MQMPSGLDDFDAFVYLPGNDYRRSMVQQFMTYLWHATGKRVIFVQLLENKSEHYDYDALEPKPYSDYIARSIGHPGKYVMMGISMGCLHIANFAHFYPQWCHRCMFMFEPTIMQGIYPLLYDFEDGRGNGEWLADLKEQPNNLDIPANEKVMDISIDRHYEIPESVQRIGVIYTTRSNRGDRYTDKQRAAKEKYYRYLGRRHTTYLLQLNTSHCIDTQPRFFEQIVDFVLKILNA